MALVQSVYFQSGDFSSFVLQPAMTVEGSRKAVKKTPLLILPLCWSDFKNAEQIHPLLTKAQVSMIFPSSADQLVILPIDHKSCLDL